MTPCPMPVPTPCPIYNHESPTQSINHESPTQSIYLKINVWNVSQNCSNFVKIFISVCKMSHAHLQNSFNLCAKFQTECLKPLRGDITQSCYPILKPNLKIVYVDSAVILSKINFVSAQSHMHIFSELATSVQSFKLNAWKLWENLITQTCYPILKWNLKIVSKSKMP